MDPMDKFAKQGAQVVSSEDIKGPPIIHHDISLNSQNFQSIVIYLFVFSRISSCAWSLIIYPLVYSILSFLIFPDILSLVIFASLRSIHMFHSVLLEDITKRVKEWSKDQCIADVFLGLVHYLKVYKIYVQNYANSLKRVSALKKERPAFYEFLEKCSEHPSAGKQQVL